MRQWRIFSERLDGSDCMQSETSRAGKQHLSANPPGYATSEQAPLRGGPIFLSFDIVVTCKFMK